MTLNCWPSSSISSTPERAARSSSWPCATRPATPRSRLIGTVRLRAAIMPVTSDAPSASIPAPMSALRICSSVASRVEYGSLTMTW